MFERANLAWLCTAATPRACPVGLWTSGGPAAPAAPAGRAAIAVAAASPAASWMYLRINMWFPRVLCGARTRPLSGLYAPGRPFSTSEAVGSILLMAEMISATVSPGESHIGA